MNQALKPYFVLACVAFFVGFVSYLAMGSLLATPAQAQDEWQATISTPAMPADNAPLAHAKRI